MDPDTKDYTFFLATQRTLFILAYKASLNRF